MKALVLESLFNKVTTLQPATLLKKGLTTGGFFEFCETFTNSYFKEHFWVTAYVKNQWPYSALITSKIFTGVATNLIFKVSFMSAILERIFFVMFLVSVV